MKKNVYLMATMLLATSMLMISCKTSQTAMEVLRPADINVPQHVKSVAVANRSLPGKEDKLMNILEGLITGEQIFADREGSNNCVNGLVQNLNSGPRFAAVLASSSNLYGTGKREFAPALTWIRVDSICKAYGVDALILLETFDSNTGYKESSKDVKRTKDGKEYYEKVFMSELCIDVNAGWRIYDNVNKRIIDQNDYLDGRCWKGEGPNIGEAQKKLPSKRNAINQAGYFAGQQYGLRISPNWVRVTRTYFVGGHDGFKEAKKHVRYDNWSAAEQIWENLTKDPDPKVAGRAYYNLALASEMKGELDKAIQYANRSFREYRIKEGRSYQVILERRKADEYRLDQQMRSE
jgi:hypothetical protein